MKSRFILSMLTVVLIFMGFAPITAEADPLPEDSITVTSIDSEFVNQLTTHQKQNSIMSNEKTYTVTTPNPHFTGQRRGVQFENGEGQATEEDAKILVDQYGYSCEELETADEADSTDEPDEENQKSESGSKESEETTNKADSNDETNEEKAADEDAETVKVEEFTESFSNEKIEMVKVEDVAFPKQGNTNPALKAFMDAHDIDYETDDNKADLNLKIEMWVEEQIADETTDENDGSGEADSEPEA